MKKTVVIGASPNADRYSYKAVNLLHQHKHQVVAVGIREGKIGEIDIIKGLPQVEDVHTVSLYVGPDKQPEYYDYIFSLKPKRIIFNPGTENQEFYDLAAKNNIEAMEACTLVLLNIGDF